jgi:hypothetical protein
MISRSSQCAGFSFVIACFSGFAAIASFVGAFFPAVVVAHWNAPSDWRIFLIVLTNGISAGACIGAVCGLFFVLGYRISGLGSHEASDRSLNMLQAPLFVFGAASGALVGTLTTTRFHEQWIWLWWRASA